MARDIHHCYAHNPPVMKGIGATMWLRSVPSDCRFLMHPAMAYLHQSCLDSSNTAVGNDPATKNDSLGRMRPVGNRLSISLNILTLPRDFDRQCPNRSVMSRRKEQSAFDPVSEFDRGRIVAYQDC
ncbi:hypothetical protein TNCV_1516841 [Trichonephila clavipes]|nr:hypothetical protein TNCV_1516841 [Trichonephila clavipes]